MPAVLPGRWHLHAFWRTDQTLPPLTGFLREHPGAGAAPASWRPSGPGVAAWCLRTLPWAWTQAGGSGSAETLATSPGPILPR